MIVNPGNLTWHNYVQWYGTCPETAWIRSVSTNCLQTTFLLHFLITRQNCRMGCLSKWCSKLVYSTHRATIPGMQFDFKVASAQAAHPSEEAHLLPMKPAPSIPDWSFCECTGLQSDFRMECGRLLFLLSATYHSFPIYIDFQKWLFSFPSLDNFFAFLCIKMENALWPDM